MSKLKFKISEDSHHSEHQRNDIIVRIKTITTMGGSIEDIEGVWNLYVIYNKAQQDVQ